MKKFSVLFIIFLLPSLSLANMQISGKIIGADGKVPALAHVHLINFQGNFQQPFQTVTVGKDGQFNLQVSEQGLYRLFVTAVNHEHTTIPLILDAETNDVEIDIQLASLEYKKQFDLVQILGDWNKFGFNDAEEMQKQADGTFIIEREISADTITYQLIGLTEALRSVNGTQADYYVYDGGGDYRSVIKAKPGVVKIIFDPRKLLRIKEKDLPKVVLGKKNTQLKKLWEIDLSVQKQREAFQAAVAEYQKTHEDMKDFKYDWSEAVTLLKSKMSDEKDIVVRQFAAIQLGQLIPYRAEIDSATKLAILELLPPNSVMWAASPRLPLMLQQDEEKNQQFLKALFDENPDRTVQAIALAYLTMIAQHEGDEEAFKNYYEKLNNEYADVREIQFDLKQLDPNKRIMVGKPVPDFEVTLLDGQEKVSNKSLLGKFYLMDFWAVWCGPCVGEMGHLHAAYEKFKNNNFVLLSLSLDRTPEDIAKFRQEKWKMPWLHAFLNNEDNKEVIETFEVMAIPKAVFVGPDGMILATEGDLRGENLELILANHLKDTR